MKLERRIKENLNTECSPVPAAPGNLQPAATSDLWVEPAYPQELRNDADIWIFPLGELADSERAVQGRNLRGYSQPFSPHLRQ